MVSGNSRSGKGPSKEAKDLYKVKVKTGDKRNAGTHAKVFLMVKGSKGKISKQRLFGVSGLDEPTETPTFHFRPGSCHTFNVYGVDVGEIKSISLEHDGLLEKQAWFVAEVSITSVAKGKSWHFVCHKWLSLFHTDCQRERTFYPVTSSDRQRLSGTYTKAAGGPYPGAHALPFARSWCLTAMASQVK
ncbi:hypothetical protein AAFF_G00400470 [Aldrovandia affinis]|uniref:PLAT domain-containing protein n=1 Tax=Aldrovandia affinis TaxID=143900 RepID=A0AAD7SCY1_9TELE|nr:hypothetical protein AAFF_G00400470 [Aldrovandia affinis]